MTTTTANTGIPGIVQNYRDALHRSWSKMSVEGRIITVCLALMIVGGVLLRIQSLGYPTWFTFDEEGFVKNAHNYGLRVPDNNDHPPLGKLLIAVGMMLFGYNSLGWRFVPLVFAIQTVVLTFWLARAVFGRNRTAWIATAFVAGDGFFISYSRSALFDGMMLTFILWAMVLAYEAISWRAVLACGVMIGLAMTCKWVAVVTVVPATLVLLWRRRVSIFSILWFAVVPVIHIAIWSGALALTGLEHGVAVTWKTMFDLYKHHLGLGKYHNDLSSPWWGWPIALHPVVIKYSSSGLRGRYSTSLSNLLLFTSVTLLALAFPLASFVVAVKNKFKRYWLPFMDRSTTRGALQMLLGWF